jgi:RNA polymerase subunit RPABC4/transcription elongation factor Spt4
VIAFKFNKKNSKSESSTTVSACDGCEVLIEENKYKCASCIDLDFCENCFIKYEIKGDTSKDECFEQVGHKKTEHAFYYVKDYKQYDINY